MALGLPLARPRGGGVHSLLLEIHLVSFFPSLGNYSVIRSVRALRPLRALKRMPGMPLLVQSILAVLPKLANVVMLCGFVFAVFGIVGTELFQGAMHYRCAESGFR